MKIRLVTRHVHLNNLANLLGPLLAIRIEAGLTLVQKATKFRLAVTLGLMEAWGTESADLRTHTGSNFDTHGIQSDPSCAHTRSSA